MFKPDLLTSNLAFLAPAIPIAAFFAIALFGRYMPGKGAYLSITAIGGSFVIFWIVLFGMLREGAGEFAINWFDIGESGARTVFSWGEIIDPLSVVMLGLISFIALLIQIYSLAYMRGESRYGWYFAVHSLFAGAMMALVLADNLLLLYITWELVGLGSYLLIGFWWERRTAAEAAKKAFITTRIGDVCLLIGIMLLFKATGTFKISTIFEAVRSGAIDSSTLNWSALLIFLGAAGKSAQVPFHVWLPDAMEGPTPVSALIHAATMVAAGIFLVARLFPLFEAVPVVLTIMASVGLVTAILASAMAMVMTDLKRVLAYSTVSHLGLMTLCLGVGAPGVAVFHLVAHAFSKAVLFLGAGSISHGTGQTDIRRMGNLWRKMPLTSITFAIGALSLAGLPPLSGFWTKEEILFAVTGSSMSSAFVILTFCAVGLSVLYIGRMLYLVLVQHQGKEIFQAHESPSVMTVPMAVLAVFAVAAGFLVFDWVAGFPGIVGYVSEGGAHGFEPNWVLTAVSMSLFLMGVVITWLVYERGLPTPQRVRQRLGWLPELLERKMFFDDVYQWFVSKVVLVTSSIIGSFDRAVVNDIGVDGPAKGIVWQARLLRHVQTGMLYNYALGMVVGALIAGLIWWMQ